MGSLVSAATDQITVEQFDEMVLPPSCEWELADGTVVSVTFPTRPHGDLQDCLATVFKRIFGATAVVRIEYPYTLGSYSKHRADVAVVSPGRHESCPHYLDGAPELVVEILSRSNLPYKVDDLEERCLRRGTLYSGEWT
jgi:Uma2 family endonuclease